MSKSSIRVLIVDDELSVRTAYARLARSAGMGAQTFASIDELLREILPESNACIISDIRMPGVNGLELPGLLAKAGCSLPVIFITAQDTPETRTAIQRVGAAAYFRKPVDDQALLDAIEWATNHQSEIRRC